MKKMLACCMAFTLMVVGNLAIAQSFTLVQTLPLTLFGGDASWGDYDKDGDLDLAVMGLNNSERPLTTILQNDNGVFKRTNIRLTQASYGNIEWGDYDNDNDVDLLYTGNSIDAYHTRLYENRNGRFVKKTIPIPDLQSGYVSFGDYDKDGDLDIAAIGLQPGNLPLAAVYKYQNGAYVNIQAGITPNYQGVCKWGDADADGDPDLLIVARNESGIYTNNNGVFTKSNVILPKTLYSRACWFDFNNDNRNDLVITGLFESTIPFTKVWKNDGALVFTEIAQELPPRGSEGVSFIDVADLNADGLDDFGQSGTDFVIRTDGAFYISLGNNGFFSKQVIPKYFNDGNESIFRFGDFDQDGDIDLITASFIYRNEAVQKRKPVEKMPVLQVEKSAIMR